MYKNYLSKFLIHIKGYRPNKIYIIIKSSIFMLTKKLYHTLVLT